MNRQAVMISGFLVTGGRYAHRLVSGIPSLIFDSSLVSISQGIPINVISTTSFCLPVVLIFSLFLSLLKQLPVFTSLRSYLFYFYILNGVIEI